MQSVIERLAGGAPDDVAPLDHQRLTQRARELRRRRRAGFACLTSLAVVAIAVGGLLNFRANDGRTSLASAPVAPDGTPLGEGFGKWHEGTEAPTDPLYQSFDGVLSDGRVLVWGGYREGEDPRYSPAGEQRGAIYDPNADNWTEIPPPPSALYEPRVRLANDRMLVVGSTESGTLGGHLFDAQAHSWSELPTQNKISIFADSISWDGETAVLVRMDEGGHGHADYPGLDWSVSRPVTLRWNRGDDAWSQGAPVPLSLRFGAGTLAYDGQIYVIGGTGRSPHIEDEPAPGELGDPFARADGAVYDVEEDRWNPLPDLPEPGIHVHIGALGDGTILAGGALTTLRPRDQGVGLGSSWVLDGSAWSPFPAHPDPGSAAAILKGIVQTTSLSGHSGPQPEWISADGGWELAPLANLHRWEHLLIATSGTIDNPDDGAFTVKLRAARDNWLTSADAPFTNRMDAVIQVSGNKLVVIGGFEGRALTETHSVWVLDLTP